MQDDPDPEVEQLARKTGKMDFEEAEDGTPGARASVPAKESEAPVSTEQQQQERMQRGTSDASASASDAAHQGSVDNSASPVRKVKEEITTTPRKETKDGETYTMTETTRCRSEITARKIESKSLAANETRASERGSRH